MVWRQYIKEEQALDLHSWDRASEACAAVLSNQKTYAIMNGLLIGVLLFLVVDLSSAGVVPAWRASRGTKALWNSSKDVNQFRSGASIGRKIFLFRYFWLMKLVLPGVSIFEVLGIALVLWLLWSFPYLNKNFHFGTSFHTALVSLICQQQNENSFVSYNFFFQLKKSNTLEIEYS